MRWRSWLIGSMMGHRSVLYLTLIVCSSLIVTIFFNAILLLFLILYMAIIVVRSFDMRWVLTFYSTGLSRLCQYAATDQPR